MLKNNFSILIKVTGFSLFCCFLLAACAGEEKQNRDSVFFDTHGFISNQIEQLEKINPRVDRQNQLQDQNEEITLSDVDWKSELELFLTSDINKSSYLGSYTITKIDSLTTEYLLIEGETLPVKKMRVQLNQNNGLPQKMEVELYRKNKLFDMEKNLVLSAGDVNGQWLIEKYQISGYQEVLFLGKNSFAIKGDIRY